MLKFVRECCERGGGSKLLINIIKCRRQWTRDYKMLNYAPFLNTQTELASAFSII